MLSLRAMGVLALVVAFGACAPRALCAQGLSDDEPPAFALTSWIEAWPDVDSVLVDDEPAKFAPQAYFEYQPLSDAAACDCEPWSWMLLPDGLMYTSYAAGEREPRLSTAFLHEQGGQTLWDSALGGRAGIARYGNTSSIHPEGWQIDVEGAAFVRLLPEDERDVQAVDFRAGVPLTYRQGRFQWKFGYYHISSHLGDEFLLKNPGFNRLNYSRDALVMGVGYFPGEAWRVYAEVGWACIYTSGGAEPWEIQTGFEYDHRRPTGIRGEPYFAANVYLREEVNWGGNLNVLAGWQWRGRASSRVFRAGLQYFNGKNSQFSFLQDNQQLLGGGIRYDY